MCCFSSSGMLGASSSIDFINTAISRSFWMYFNAIWASCSRGCESTNLVPSLYTSLDARQDAMAFLMYCAGTRSCTLSKDMSAIVGGRWARNKGSRSLRSESDSASNASVNASVAVLMLLEMIWLILGNATVLPYAFCSRNSSSASSLARPRSLASTSDTMASLLAKKSSWSGISMAAQISYELVITPPLLADESFTMETPASSQSACRASFVTNRLAPSTISRDDGVARLSPTPSLSKKFL
mmetsp:Transcript_6059/g.16510  ORF Transcript_6059/g.16510 Transcript_6059/m.16510 type:complete len:242 (+) Transcript_6059:774-1499(+)